MLFQMHLLNDLLRIGWIFLLCCTAHGHKLIQICVVYARSSASTFMAILSDVRIFVSFPDGHFKCFPSTLNKENHCRLLTDFLFIVSSNWKPYKILRYWMFIKFNLILVSSFVNANRRAGSKAMEKRNWQKAFYYFALHAIFISILN